MMLGLKVNSEQVRSDMLQQQMIRESHAIVYCEIVDENSS